ncbi:MAG: YgiT-type zinc finger protein [Desulfococcaceae bacterium]
MKKNDWNETMTEQKVTYTLQTEDTFIVIENVPARVCAETGERFFSPETVEKIQETVWKKRKPGRMMQTPVYEFAA